MRQAIDLSNIYKVKIPVHGIQQDQVQQNLQCSMLPCLQLADQDPDLMETDKISCFTQKQKAKVKNMHETVQQMLISSDLIVS